MPAHLPVAVHVFYSGDGLPDVIAFPQTNQSEAITVLRLALARLEALPAPGAPPAPPTPPPDQEDHS